MRTLTYQATHKKLLAPVTLDHTPDDLEAQESLRLRIAKIRKELILLGGGASTVKRYQKITAPSHCCWLLVLVALSPPRTLFCPRRSSSSGNASSRTMSGMFLLGRLVSVRARNILRSVVRRHWGLLSLTYTRTLNPNP